MNTDLLNKVDKYIHNNNLLDTNQDVIVGLSGGKDSMALLHILSVLNYKCLAAHCNFHLREEESNRDELFVKDYCKNNKIKLTTTSFDTYKYMKEEGVSLEMAARKLRYDWFEFISQKSGINNIAIAHHQDDSVETVLINMTRGCGIRGLTGISKKNGKIVRPLLCLSRKEISDYIRLNNIPFVNDSTNDESIYIRNKIRLNILPLFEEINPSVKKTISQMSDYLSDVENIYTKSVNTLINQIFDGTHINIQKLKTIPQAKTILFELLHSYGFNNETVYDIYEAIDSLSGKIFYSENYRLIKDREYFIIDKKKVIQNDEKYFIYESDSQINKPLNITIRKLNKNNVILEKRKEIIYIDKSKIIYPLHIRKWKQGDKFTPFGMKGKKKISDYFSDKKFNLIQKENIWLLCNHDDKIIWIVGERADDSFKITENTQEIIVFEQQIEKETK